MAEPNEEGGSRPVLPIMSRSPPHFDSHQGSAPMRLTDFARSTVVAVLIAIVLVGLAWGLVLGVHVLLETFAGILFAVFLTALSDWTTRHTRLSYGWSLFVVVMLLIIAASGIGFLLSNRLAAQIGELRTKLPQSLQEIKQYLSQYSWGQLILDQLPTSSEAMGQLGGFAQFKGLISGVASFLITIVVILFVGLFGAVEPRLYRAGALHLVPPRQRQRVADAIDATVINLRWWLLGQILLMIIIGITTTLGLWLIGIPLALALGVIAGILEIVPYAGPWLAAVPAALIALLISPLHLIGTLALYLFLHILEGYILFPLIQRRAVLLPPALTLVTQVLLGELLGILGLFVAAPLTVVTVVLLKMLYVEDTLGDQAVKVPGEPDRGIAPRSLP